jgi:hypothetical protein
MQMENEDGHFHPQLFITFVTLNLFGQHTEELTMSRTFRYNNALWVISACSSLAEVDRFFQPRRHLGAQ